MKVLFVLPSFGKSHGGEWFARNLIPFLDDFDVKVYCKRGGEVQTDLRKWAEWSDVIIAHLGGSAEAWNVTRGNRPIYHILHNTLPGLLKVKKENQFCLYNSEWTRLNMRAPLSQPGIVLHFPFRVTDYQTTTGDGYTLVNCEQNKGGGFLGELAAVHKGRFIGVKGGYGEPVICEGVEYMENQNILNVFNQTKILLMPSNYESWGQVGIEAMCSGIPVIASEKPSLRDSLSYAGHFCHGRDVEEWSAKIDEVEKNYSIYSELALKRAYEAEAQVQKDILKLKEFLHVGKSKSIKTISR